MHAAQLDLLRGRVELEVAWDEEAAVVCPECRKECARRDHAPEREWRHLNVMQFLTVIRARVPRCRCPEHGVKTVRTPWAEPGSHFTLHFEAFAVQLIGACRSLTHQWRYVHFLNKCDRKMDQHEHESGIVKPRLEI